MDSRATESRPPESPNARCAPGEIAGASTVAARSGSSHELDFLELPITHQALETLFDEFLGTLLRQAPQRVGKSSLQALGHGHRIAMRTAQWFIDDSVDQPE